MEEESDARNPEAFSLSLATRVLLFPLRKKKKKKKEKGKGGGGGEEVPIMGPSPSRAIRIHLPQSLLFLRKEKKREKGKRAVEERRMPR